MKHLFSVNSEGGPLLLADAVLARSWEGAEHSEKHYQDLCDKFDAAPQCESVYFKLEEQNVLAWELRGAGVADVFLEETGIIRIVRAWSEIGSDDEVAALAVVPSNLGYLIGSLVIPSGTLAILWAVESGQNIPSEIENSFSRVSDSCLEGAAYVIKVKEGKYSCSHDVVRVGSSSARRLTIEPFS